VVRDYLRVFYFAADITPINSPMQQTIKNELTAEAAKAYQANKEEWDQQYAGQYVAVCQSKVMDSDADENELAERMIEKQLTEKKRFQGCILKIRGHRKKRLNPKEKASSSSRTSLA